MPASFKEWEKFKRSEQHNQHKCAGLGTTGNIFLTIKLISESKTHSTAYYTSTGCPPPEGAGRCDTRPQHRWGIKSSICQELTDLKHCNISAMFSSRLQLRPPHTTETKRSHADTHEQ